MDCWKQHRRVPSGPDKAVQNRRGKLKLSYGITEAEYDRLRSEQRGLCAICHRTDTRRLAVDHDHVSGQVRGLLCGNCNRELGFFQDIPELMRIAADYLERHSAR